MTKIVEQRGIYFVWYQSADIILHDIAVKIVAKINELLLLCVGGSVQFYLQVFVKMYTDIENRV